MSLRSVSGFAVLKCPVSRADAAPPVQFPTLLDLLADPTLDLAAHFQDDAPTPTEFLQAA